MIIIRDSLHINRKFKLIYTAIYIFLHCIGLHSLGLIFLSLSQFDRLKHSWNVVFAKRSLTIVFFYAGVRLVLTLEHLLDHRTFGDL
jgi:hypothetical protein